MKQANLIKHSQKFNQTHKLRIIPQNGSIWIVLGDVCKALNERRERALAVLPDEDKRTVELEGGKSCQIVSVNGFYSLIWENRSIIGMYLAEWLISGGNLDQMQEQEVLTPATVEEFTKQFAWYYEEFERELTAPNP